MLRNWGCSFLNSSCFISGMFLYQSGVYHHDKIRIKAPLQLLLPSTCICGSSLDDFGDHLFKCRIGGEWDHRHSVLVHLMASIFRSVQLPLQHKLPLQNLGPLCKLDTTGTGRMEIVTYSDFPPTFAQADVDDYCF